MNKRIILIVNGYGCNLDSPLGAVYLPRVFQYIEEHSTLLAVIVFCGGETQKKKFPGRTEAQVMKNFIVGRWARRHPGQDFPVECGLIERSYTSLESNQECLKWLLAYLIVGSWAGRVFPEGLRIVQFCEAQRAPSTVMLAQHFLSRFVETPVVDITVETTSWEQADPFKQAWNLIYNKLAITYPRLGLAERERRRRIRRSFEI